EQRETSEKQRAQHPCAFCFISGHRHVGCHEILVPLGGILVGCTRVQTSYHRSHAGTSNTIYLEPRVLDGLQRPKMGEPIRTTHREHHACLAFARNSELATMGASRNDNRCGETE